jgi:hypothetical protein
MANDSNMKYQDRVDRGRAREKIIMQELTKHGFEVSPASNLDDILKGIDCHAKIKGKIYSTQIKARQSSEDLLFVITEDGKPSKDMKTQAELYAFLIKGKMYLIESRQVRKALNDLIDLMGNSKSKCLISYKGVDCEMSYQIDPVKRSVKLMAFIPTDLFTDVVDPVVPAFRIDL